MVFSEHTTQFPDKVAIQALIAELKAYADSVSGDSVDLSDYVTKTELQSKLDALDINIDLSVYATKEELTAAINSIDLSDYAKKADIPSVPTKVSQLENDAGYLKEHQDLSKYALKTEIPNISLDGYATESYVDNKVTSIPAVDLSNYYTKSETYNKEEVNTLVSNSGDSSGSGNTSGGNTITYAYDTEIATGETWIDGKPIYLRVFHIDALKSQSKVIDYNEYYNQTKFADTIISVNPTWHNGNSISTGFMADVVSPVSTSSSSVGSNVNSYILAKMMWCTVYNGSDFHIIIGRGSSRYTASCDVFVKYTKL